MTYTDYATKIGISAEPFSKLTTHAARLCIHIWLEMKRQRSDQIRTSNGQVAKRAFMSLVALERAQAELQHNPIILIEHDVRPGFTFEARSTKYTCIDPESQRLLRSGGTSEAFSTSKG